MKSDSLGELAKWRSHAEIRDEISSLSNSSPLRLAASLSVLFRGALLSPSYVADPAWTESIVLSDAGNTLLHAFGLNKESDQATIKLALFKKFFHHHCLINCDASDLAEAQRVLDEELRGGKLFLALRWGRTLYDRYNDTFCEVAREEHLQSHAVLDLLAGTPIGVYQAGDIITGPLGLLQAQEARYIPPSRVLHLWHCSDIGCEAVHNVELLQPETALGRREKELSQLFSEMLGPASAWKTPLRRLIFPILRREPYTYFDIPLIIAETVFGAERQRLFEKALTSVSGPQLRAMLSASPKGVEAGRGSPSAISSRLNETELLQLLLVLRNRELVGLIDECIERQVICVPKSETRRAASELPFTHGVPNCTASSLGIRSSSKHPLVDLSALIWEAYCTNGRKSDLDWKLRNGSESSTRNALHAYLCNNEPQVIVRDLILSSDVATTSICRRIGLKFDGPHDSSLGEKLLWKLGFDVPRFGESMKLLRTRLESFYQELIAIGSIRGEHDRSRIRASGVNLFVSAEFFIQQLVSYNVWLLASDHVLETRFTYDARQAMKAVSTHIGAYIRSGESTIQWQERGENSLGILLAYFNAMNNWMRGLLSADRALLVRPNPDLPFYSDDPFIIYPHLHTALWADSDYGALSKYVDLLGDLGTRMARSGISKIRNGIDHWRDESQFPKVDEMLAFVAHFREAIDLADSNRCIPKEYWLESRSSGRYGSMAFEFKDYNGRAHRIYGPAFVHDLGAHLEFGNAILIAPGGLLGYVNADLRFSIVEPSSYEAYWKNYPRRASKQAPDRDKKDAGAAAKAIGDGPR